MQPGSLLCTIGQGFQRTTYTFPPDGLCNIITFDSLYRKHASLAPPYPKDFEYFLETAKKARQSEFSIGIHRSNPAAWEDVLRNVMRAVNRELTIRDIKERVDLLIGYFRQQDTVNLRKSGTEEQYEERKQLLQDVSDLMRDVDYAPQNRAAERQMAWGRRKKTAWGRDSPLNN
ncbi:hypothetical protein MRX96_026701 [Rhipicephalus microplus]